MDFLKQALSVNRILEQELHRIVSPLLERLAAMLVAAVVLALPSIIAGLICALPGYVVARIFKLNRKRGAMLGAIVGICIGAVFVWLSLFVYDGRHE